MIEHAIKYQLMQLQAFLDFQSFEISGFRFNEVYNSILFSSPFVLQWNLDLRKPDLRKNLDLRKIVGTTDFLVHKLFDLRKIF